MLDQARRFVGVQGMRFLSRPGLNDMQAFFAVEPVVAAVLGTACREQATAEAAPTG